MKMFDFDVLDQLEQGLKASETALLRGERIVGDMTVAAHRADHLARLSDSLLQRSRNARIEGLHT